MTPQLLWERRPCSLWYDTCLLESRSYTKIFTGTSFPRVPARLHPCFYVFCSFNCSSISQSVSHYFQRPAGTDSRKEIAGMVDWEIRYRLCHSNQQLGHSLLAVTVLLAVKVSCCPWMYPKRQFYIVRFRLIGPVIFFLIETIPYWAQLAAEHTR